MKSKNKQITILNDQDLITWDENAPPPSLKIKIRRMVFKTADFVLECIFRGVGLYSRGYRNAHDLKVRHLELSFPELPGEFHETNVLFMSDLHLGWSAELPDLILGKIQKLKVDLCLFGGDYRRSFTVPRWPFIADLKRIVSMIQAPLGIYGVLGNHDGLEVVPALENLGVRILLNNSVSVQKGGKIIYLAGVDEIFSRRHDLKKTFLEVPEKAFCIFLGHSPDLYREVEVFGAHLYLCGHTHHGQVQFPLVGPLVTNTSAPRKLAGGLWRYGNLAGYTSAGTGSGAPMVRFLCPPEICLITLKKSSTA